MLTACTVSRTRSARPTRLNAQTSGQNRKRTRAGIGNDYLVAGPRGYEGDRQCLTPRRAHSDRDDSGQYATRGPSKFAGSEDHGPPLLWLVSPDSDGMTGKRLVATRWPPDRSGREAAEAAIDQAGWPN